MPSLKLIRAFFQGKGHKPSPVPRGFTILARLRIADNLFCFVIFQNFKLPSTLLAVDLLKLELPLVI